MKIWQDLMLLLEVMNKMRRSRNLLNMSREQVRALQRKKFQRLVAHVYDKSPYYRQVIHMRNIDRSNCGPEDFPILTKSALLEHFDHIVTDPEVTRAGLETFVAGSRDPRDLFLGKYYACHSSGSSGFRACFVYSQREFLEGSLSLLRSTDLRFHKRLAFVGVGYPHLLGQTMTMAAKRLRPIYEDVQTFDINAPFAATIEGLNRMQPTDVAAYAHTLRQLAEAQEAKQLRIRPQFLQASAEPLSSADKDYIQRVFKTPVTNLYATTEHIVMGLGTDRFQGMYLMDDRLIFELLPTAVRVTNLYNYTLPLIRYELPDVVGVDPYAPSDTPFTKV